MRLQRQHLHGTRYRCEEDYTDEQVADEYEQLGKEGRFSKKCIPQGYIPDFDWTTIHQDHDQPIKPIKHEDPSEVATTPAAPTEVEGPPSSHLRSKTKQQSTSNEQGQREHNPTPMDPPERNLAEIEVNTVDIAPKHYSLMQWAKLLLYTKRIHQTPSPSGYKMHYCSSNGCMQLKMQTYHSQNCSIEQACT